MSEKAPELKTAEDKSTKVKWVKFEDDVLAEAAKTSKSVDVEKNTENSNLTSPCNPPNNSFRGAILPTESIHININNVQSSDIDGVSREIKLRNDNSEDSNGVSSGQSSSSIRQAFSNGDVIVTLLPVNSMLPWITPAKFRPELVPEELMAQCLTLTVEDYVHVMEMLTNDFRFTLYNVCYKRILIIWIFMALLFLLALLISGAQGLTLFSLGVMWLVLNSAAVFLCMWLKIKLNHNLERCMGHINRHLMRHKIILGLDDRGRVSCHKVNLCFIYLDTSECVKKLQQIIENEEASGRVVNTQLSREDRNLAQKFQDRMDINDQDIIIQGSNVTRVSRKQIRGEQLLSRYIQRWSKDYLRHRLDWTVDGEGGNAVDTRHLSSALCPCQYIEEYLRCKPRIDRRAFCPVFTAYLRDRGVD